VNNDERVMYAKQLIQGLNYLTLATCDRDGQPWNTPVFGAYDGHKTFYWGSRHVTQHSQNISQNSRGFIVIYDSTVKPNHGEAVYLKVLCEELAQSEIDAAIQLLHAKLGESYMVPKDVQGASPRRLYKATVTRAWIKDPNKDMREEFTLG
jgi:hypothetical protein